MQAERDRQAASIPANGDREADMLAEAKLLRQHKNRLEGRMRILEDHNRQLEAQLKRLRHLLEQVSPLTSISFRTATQKRLTPCIIDSRPTRP